MKDERAYEETVRHLRRLTDQATDALPRVPYPGRLAYARPSRPYAQANLRALLAAGVVSAVLGYPAYRGWLGPETSMPAVFNQVHLTLRSIEPSTSRHATRSSDAGRRFRLAIVDHAPLLLMVTIPRSVLPPDGSARFTARNLEGEAVWSTELEVEYLAHLLTVNEHDAVSLPASLPPGQYELQLDLRTGDAWRRAAARRFELVAP